MNLNEIIEAIKEQVVTLEAENEKTSKAARTRARRAANEIKKLAAIGVRVSKWIAYHGFAINIDNDLSKYKSIIPCGISDKGVINLKKIKDQDYDRLGKIIIDTFSKNLEI